MLQQTFKTLKCTLCAHFLCRVAEQRLLNDTICKCIAHHGSAQLSSDAMRWCMQEKTRPLLDALPS